VTGVRFTPSDDQIPNHYCKASSASRVVRGAARALVPKYVKLNKRVLLTVVADDTDLHILVIRGHRSFGDLSIHFSPEVFVLVQGHAADWTSQGLQASERHLQLPQAILMYGVSTLQYRHLKGGLE